VPTVAQRNHFPRCRAATLVACLALHVGGAIASVTEGAPAWASPRTESAILPCTDTWVGGGKEAVWNEADNWSTGRVPGTDAINGLTAIGSDAVFDVQTTISLAGSLTSHGSIEIGGYDGGGTLALGGALTVQAGEISMNESAIDATSVDVDAGAGVSGSGTVSAKLVNNGSVAPAGTLKVGANFSQGAGGGWVSVSRLPAAPPSMEPSLPAAYPPRCRGPGPPR
jgi:hypothetical protein